jgi:cobalt-zinc-cadmium efflux system outer membrane protein
MHQQNYNNKNYPRRFSEGLDRAFYQGQRGRLRLVAGFTAGLLLIIIFSHQMRSQEKSPDPLKVTNPASVGQAPPAQPQTNAPQNRSLTITEAVSIFLQQNLQLVAARYEIDLVDAEKLTARLRPDPEISLDLADIPFDFRRNFVNPQTYSYGISQTVELGGKRLKRITAADANSELARAEFQIVVWQLTNDLKKKFYTVLLAESLLNLAKENEKTLEEVIKRTTEVYRSGEISGLDLQRLEVEKFKFDTDLANSERDYELALRDLRVTLGGDYQTMNIGVAGEIYYYQTYDFSFADLRDKALAARPDLKVAQVRERAANAAIRLQEAQRIPDLTVGAGIDQVPAGGSTYTVGFSIPIPISHHNQEERAKSLIQKKKAQNDQQFITNQVLSEVDKALVAFGIQKRRLELYRTGVLKKVNDIQNLTEFSLKVGESSTLELLDAIRTRRDTLAAFYQTIFDYQMALLDLELATATPLQK